MSKKTRKIFFNATFLIALITLTIWAIFKDQDLGVIIHSLSKIPPGYLLAGFGLVLLFLFCEAVIIKYLFHTVKIHSSLWDTFCYACTDFFYSCITPSASGGQPMEAFYMKKKGIHIPAATIVLMVVTIEYKFVLVLIGLALAIFDHPLIHSLPGQAQFFLYLGIGLNTVFVGLMAFLVFIPDTASYLITKLYHFLKRIHLLKEKNNREERLQQSMERYKTMSVHLKNNKLAIFNTTLITIIQRLVLFALTYVAYRGLGLHGESFVRMLILQAVISISVDMLPFPGGLGISEHLYLLIFTPIFGSAMLTTTSLLVSRGFSYYVLVIVSGIFSLILHLTTLDKSKGRLS